MPAKSYQRFVVETESGDGEAVKAASDQPWVVTIPQGGFEWYGTVKQVQKEIVKRYTDPDPESYINFGPVENEPPSTP